MATQLRSAGFQAIGPRPAEIDEATPCKMDLSRLIPLALALYLTPVLLIVLVVGAVGMSVLAVVRLFNTVVKAPAGWRRTSGQTRSPLI